MPADHFSDVTQLAEGQPGSGAFYWLSAITGFVVIAMGSFVLIGWANDVEVLKRIYPGFTAMNPLTAVCLMLSGIAVLLARVQRMRGAFVAGSSLLIVAIAKAADFAWGIAPVDQLLFANRLGEGSGPANAMAPNTAFALSLVGLSLIFATGKHRRSKLISQALGTSVLAVSMFALIGYAYGINQLNSVGMFIPMALHTGLALAIVSLGLLSLTSHLGVVSILRDAGPAGSMARIALPLAMLIPLPIGALRLWGQVNGYYGIEAGVALQVISNVLITSILLTSSIFALHRSDRIRRRREQELTRSEASYRLAEQVASVGHWRMDLRSLQASWSDEIFSISGISKERGVPPTPEILTIYHPDDRRLVRQSVREALRDGRDWEYVARLCRPDGDLRYVRSHGVCERDQHGKLTGLFGVFADITELEQARKRAEQATAAKAAFLANMSHEIRTPLNGVMGFAELLLTSKLGAEQKRHATLIFDSAKTLLKLLNDILDVSKIDAGQLAIEQEPFDLAHQLRQCVRLMDGMSQIKNIALTLAIDPTLPKLVVGDGLRLRQILLNLLGNAIKFTPAGSVTVDAVSAASETGQPIVQINITDTGIGIPEERQALIFEEFVQADVSTARRFGGSGLGLSISQHLATLMGGELSLSSRESEGTCVTLTVPLIAAASARKRLSNPTVDPVPRSQRETKPSEITILLAEDLDINQELITAMLKRMGYKVEIAGDGKEAIRLAMQLREKPDAYGMILMDIQMPVVDGITATRAIRALGGRASVVPIIALTANAYASDIEECRSAGMVDHLSKPVSMAALGAALTRWLGTENGPHARHTNESSTAEKFAHRKVAYEIRLVELQAAISTASDDDSAPLFAEAKMIAHKLAGTAAMFGDRQLGEQAAAAEENLKAKAPNGSASIIDLIEALRRAA